jgi:Cytochrome P460
MKKTSFRMAMTVAVSVAVLGGVALAAQNGSTLKVPNGLAFSEFKGYEDWQYVAVSQTETSVKIIAANPIMIKAFRQGVPGNHQPFPEGSKIVKIEWLLKRNPESPYFVNVPDTLKTLAFIEKDSKRFPDTHGWAYADFLNDPATDTLTPNGAPPQNGTGTTCGYSCHTAVAAKDYIFTGYPKR